MVIKHEQTFPRMCLRDNSGCGGGPRSIFINVTMNNTSLPYLLNQTVVISYLRSS